MEEQVETGSWVVMELFGHKMVAGYMQKDEQLGTPLLRMEIPETSRFPSFTRHYNPAAVYSISYVSEQVAKATAEAIKDNPITIYVPEIGEPLAIQRENNELKERIENLRKLLNNARQLPDHADE